MRLIRIVLAISIVTPAFSLHAQAEHILTRGVKVRIALGARTSLAFVDTLTADALLVHERERSGAVGQAHSYRRDFLLAVDVPRSRGAGPTIFGGVLGMTGGALLGFLVGSALDDPGDFFSRNTSGAIIAMYGGVIGLPVGLIAGSMRGPRWQSVSLVSR